MVRCAAPLRTGGAPVRLPKPAGAEKSRPAGRGWKGRRNPSLCTKEMQQQARQGLLLLLWIHWNWLGEGQQPGSVRLCDGGGASFSTVRTKSKLPEGAAEYRPWLAALSGRPRPHVVWGWTSLHGRKARLGHTEIPRPAMAGGSVYVDYSAALSSSRYCWASSLPAAMAFSYQALAAMTSATPMWPWA